MIVIHFAYNDNKIESILPTLYPSFEVKSVTHFLSLKTYL